MTIITLAALACAGCIKNDIPPAPGTAPSIVEMVADGAAVTIDQSLHCVTLVLDESTDIRNVNIVRTTFNDKGVTSDIPLQGRMDLSSPVRVNLFGEKNALWTLKAVQDIGMYFTVNGQVGVSRIDAVNRRAVTQVSSSMNRKNLSITSLKLGPDGLTSYSPSPEEIHDFSNGQEIDVTCHGRTETWSLFVEQTESNVELLSAVPWTRVAWLEGSGIEGKACGFRIREKGSGEWTEVADVSSEKGSFKAMADGLSPLTEYECTAYCEDETTAVVTFTTEDELQLPNSGFETFSNAESNKYWSFYDPDSADPLLRSKWWGSGNKGSTTVGSTYSITIPDTEDFVEGKASVKLMSQYVIIKFAAGNIFSGEYYKTIGTSGGIVRMGRPFSLRPRKISFKVKYKCGKISEKTLGGYPEGDEVKVGDNDRGCVWVSLGTWDYHKYGGSADSPVEINTTDRSTFFDPEGPDVIAYGSFVTNESIEEWTTVEIPLDYRSTNTKPTHIIVSAAASMLGDYFTGSSDSVMWLDDFKLEY
ncbi:MAG: PCMD domain-containing protein [Candidatus Cryptobacteroides sp.]